MENRELLAFGLLAAMLVVSVWVFVRRMNAKRAFEYRQSGRGKNTDS